MKKTYINPELFVTAINSKDIITFSPNEVTKNTIGDGDQDYLDFSAYLNL